MTTQEVKRKLTAILSADAKGYSRLMGEDEKGTVRTLNAYKEVMTDLIRHHRGRVVDAPGDNVLAEFGSVVDAVECAVEIQKELKTRNADLPENRKMEFRIGVNLGDVIEDGEQILGDGVNIAARLESLSEAGGICISGTGFDQVKNKLSVGYQYLGKQTVKNIPDPVRAYKVLMGPEAVGKVIGEKEPKETRWGWKAVAAAVVLALVAGGVVWNFYLRAPRIEPASKEKMAFPLPDKPSIAVLPFVNMSEDKEQEYFSDGMTEDLITDLSKISGLMVIARNSTFTYKGKPVKIKQVAEELGVRYVLEGSVRRAGNEIRINAQLVDALSGHHLWAERYDGKMDRIFALQDQITQKIVSALTVKLTGSEKERVGQKGTDNIAAYDAYLEGWDHFYRYTADGLTKAAASFKKAIELDPNYGQAFAALASVYLQATNFAALLPGLKMSWFEARLRVGKYTRMAMKRPTANAYSVSSAMYLIRRQHKEAISEVGRGLALDPNNPGCHASMGWALIMAGRPKEGIEYLDKWMRLDPRNRYAYLFNRSWAHFCMGEIAEAAKLLEQAMRLDPEAQAGPMVTLAACYSLLGRDQDARTMIDLRRKIPFTGPTVAETMYMFPLKDRTVADGFVQGLIKAGHPPGKIAGGYFPAFKENQLTGEEIKRVNFGRTITGIDPNGQQWWLDKKKNGELTLRVPGAPISSDTGKTQIEGDLECIQFQKTFWGLEYCLTVFRNPRGTYEGKDEYFSCSDFGFTPWSVVR
jgi:TolB-like protein/class 3 adenylate cyclase